MMSIPSILKALRRALSYHEPLITISLSRKNLLHNLRAYRTRYPDCQVAPMLKSNAYGHGLLEVAGALDREDIAFFAVDSLYEAEKLRRGGIRSRIVVMGYVRPEYVADHSLARVDYAITDIEQLREVAALAHSNVRIHLKIDTGMHRNGILPADLAEAIDLIRGNTHLRVAGICSHLADADNPDDTFNRRQLDRWTAASELLSHAFPDIEYRHAAATKGIRFAKEGGMNVARIGMGLLGYDTSPLPDPLPLRPVLEMTSLVTSLRTIGPGESVGYNATFTASDPTVVATVPAGYFEGIDRALSGRGSYLVHGQACPLVGRVSMNMSSVDVTGVKGVARKDIVTLISRDPDAPNSVWRMAEDAGVTPYVIFAHLPEHLRRVVE